MKMRLPKLLCTAVLAAISCASAYAATENGDFSKTVNNVNYSYSYNGDGTYDANVEIGSSVSASQVASVYKEYAGDVDQLESTRIQDITFTMTGGYVGQLSATPYYGTPIDGDVTFNINGGNVGALYGGKIMDAGLQYGTPTNIDSITINIENSEMTYVTGGNGVSGAVSNDFIKNYTTTGDIAINIKNSNVSMVYGTNNTFDHIDGSLSINLDGGNFAYVLTNNNGTVSGDVAVEIDNGTVGWAVAGYTGSVGGDAAITINNGSVELAIGVTGGTVAGDANVTINGGSITSGAYGVNGGNVGGSASITIDNGTVMQAKTVTAGTVANDANLTINGGTVNYVAAAVDGGTVAGNASVTLNDGTVAYLETISKGIVKGDAELTINGGKVTTGVYTVCGEGKVEGDITVNINGGEITGDVTGCHSGHVGGDVTIVMTDGTATNVYASNVGSVAGNTAVYLLDGTVTGNVYGGDAALVGGTRTLYVGSEDKAYNGTVNDFYGFDRVIIASGSSLQATASNCEVFEIKEQQYNVTGANLKTAAITTSGTVSIEDAITLNFNVSKSLRSGRYMLIDATNGTVDTTNWTEENVTINNVTTGTTYNRRAATATGQHTVSFNDLKWIDSILYLFVVAEDLQNTLAGNWGVFKSSQAFVSTLWGGRTNAVIIPGTADGKGGLIPSGQTIAWGTAYGQSSRIGGIGADYSIFGGAIGAERRFVTGRTLGAAFGYDWGTVSPFGLSKIDQETAHFALYGRAASWKAGQKGNIVIDWSAAVGNTTSETDAINGEWEQKSLQLDARASYLYQMSEKTTNSVFVGVQYFAAEDATAGATKVNSMQNLRTEAGVGISYKATRKTTVYGEASIYNDAMRHNPCTSSNGATYSGTNPGRLGGSVSVGTMYELNERWNLHGNYSFDMADDSKEHNVNVGASYEF